jgi:regulator of PEP synthase PpsR (kinase-PPPase family)
MLPIYAVSDATGSTAEGVIRAALTQTVVPIWLR